MAEAIQHMQSAIVSRRDAQRNNADFYLQLTEGNAPLWTADPGAATAFESMREAVRAAARLPATLRAYGVPRQGEHAQGQRLH